jgi:hypothetical protein
MKRERLDRPADNIKPKPFTKGVKTGGRKKGSTNKTSRLLKEALIMAAENVGLDGQGKNGLVGFLTRVALKDPQTFMRSMEKLLPMQITGKDGSPMQVQHSTKDQIVERFKERGLPLPPSLLEMPAHGEGEGEHAN